MSVGITEKEKIVILQSQEPDTLVCICRITIANELKIFDL